MEKVLLPGRMGLFMKENENRTSVREKESITGLMATCMKESGKLIELKVLAS